MQRKVESIADALFRASKDSELIMPVHTTAKRRVMKVAPSKLVNEWIRDLNGGSTYLWKFCFEVSCCC
jgi:hypothetical protein